MQIESEGEISNSKLLQQTGNAMTSSVIEEIARNLMESVCLHPNSGGRAFRLQEK